MNLAEFLLKITGQADRIAESEQKLSGIADQLTSALATVEAKDSEISNLKTQLEAAPKAELITELEGKVTALTGELTAAQAEVAALPEKINAEAARLIAANGHQQVNTVTGSDSSNQKTISKAEFDQLTPRQKSEFSKAKGRIVG
jgi:phage shock protein A